MTFEELRLFVERNVNHYKLTCYDLTRAFRAQGLQNKYVVSPVVDQAKKESLSQMTIMVDDSLVIGINFDVGIAILQEKEITEFHDVLKRTLTIAVDLKNWFWSLRLKTPPSTPNNKGLKLSTILLMVNANGPVEDFSQATELQHFSYLVSPDMIVYKRTLDAGLIQAIMSYGLIVDDDEASLRGITGTYTAPVDRKLFVQDFLTTAQGITDKEFLRHFVANLVLIDRIFKPT